MIYNRIVDKDDEQTKAGKRKQQAEAKVIE